MRTYTPLTFTSQALATDVRFDELGNLEQAALSTLHGELTELITTLDGVLTDAKNKARASGVPLNEHWIHKVTTKKRIALKFATEIYSRLNGGTTVSQRSEYDRIYKNVFAAMMVEEFGEDGWKEVQQEAVEAARKQYQAWIAETKQTCWFVP